MKKIVLILSLVTASAIAQTKDYVGKWELCKIVTEKGDTIKIKKSDPQYINYNFEYNNTFTSFSNEKKEEFTGRWGFEFKTKTIKIKNPVLTKTRTAIGDYEIPIQTVNPDFFVEIKEVKKKLFSYRIYCRVK